MHGHACSVQRCTGELLCNRIRRSDECLGHHFNALGPSLILASLKPAHIRLHTATISQPHAHVITRPLNLELNEAASPHALYPIIHSLTHLTGLQSATHGTDHSLYSVSLLCCVCPDVFSNKPPWSPSHQPQPRASSLCQCQQSQAMRECGR